MATGRKALPDHLKMIKGTQQKCRDRKVSKKQAPGDIQAPTWLTEEALPYFDAIREELELIGVNSRTYSLVAAMAAIRINEIDLCNKDIMANGTVDRTGNTVRSNPSVTQRSESMRHLQSLCSELGLTATAVGRVGKIKETEKAHGFGSL